MPPTRSDPRRGAASVEYIALAGLIGILIVVGIAALVASPPRRGDRELGEMLARRIACSPRIPCPVAGTRFRSPIGFPWESLSAAPPRPPPRVAGGGPAAFPYARRPA